jgi:G:T-mismatch repair DNA endonuclease (very short patch repair protein)
MTQASLRALGWEVLVLWECELKDKDRTTSRVKAFMDWQET